MKSSACLLALALTNLRQQHRLWSYTLMIYGYPEKGKKVEGENAIFYKSVQDYFHSWWIFATNYDEYKKMCHQMPAQLRASLGTTIDQLKILKLVSNICGSLGFLRAPQGSTGFLRLPKDSLGTIHKKTSLRGREGIVKMGLLGDFQGLTEATGRGRGVINCEK